MQSNSEVVVYRPDGDESELIKTVLFGTGLISVVVALVSSLYLPTLGVVVATLVTVPIALSGGFLIAKSLSSDWIRVTPTSIETSSGQSVHIARIDRISAKRPAASLPLHIAVREAGTGTEIMIDPTAEALVDALRKRMDENGTTAKFATPNALRLMRY